MHAGQGNATSKTASRISHSASSAFLVRRLTIFRQGGKVANWQGGKAASWQGGKHLFGKHAFLNAAATAATLSRCEV